MLNGLKFGLANATKSYFTKSGFSNINRLATKSSFGNMDDMNMGEFGIYSVQEVEQARALNNMFMAVLIVIGVVIGFVAVPHICSDSTERGKNIRLGLYVLLIVTGGQFGWLFALLWLFKVNLCA
jgi:hypothetical protein